MQPPATGCEPAASACSLEAPDVETRAGKTASPLEFSTLEEDALERRVPQRGDNSSDTEADDAAMLVGAGPTGVGEPMIVGEPKEPAWKMGAEEETDPEGIQIARRKSGIAPNIAGLGQGRPLGRRALRTLVRGCCRRGPIPQERGARPHGVCDGTFR